MSCTSYSNLNNVDEIARQLNDVPSLPRFVETSTKRFQRCSLYFFCNVNVLSDRKFCNKHEVARLEVASGQGRDRSSSTCQEAEDR